MNICEVFVMHIVSSSEMYAIDRYTIEQIGMSEESLMENAGQSVARVLLERVQPNERIAVLAGSGNNGGDGIVIARILKSYQYAIDLWLIPQKEKVKGAAKKSLQIFENCGYEVKHYIGNEQMFMEQLNQYDVIIDALLGIGTKGTLRSPFKEIIAKVNEINKLTVYSIDVPSGISADGGHVAEAIKADVTMTIQYPKLGAYVFPTADFFGELHVVDIGIPPISVEKNTDYRRLWCEDDVQNTLPTRKRSSHKGTYGKGLVIGGSRNMAGAVVMTAKAALKSGAGLLTMAIPNDIYSVVATYFPEVMYYPCLSKDGYFSGEIDIKQFDVKAIAVGPGIGRKGQVKKIVEAALDLPVPVVLDADALYFWKDYDSIIKDRKEATIVTPHPGEMARMIDASIHEIESNRFKIAKQFAMEYGCYLVLKGPFTIVTTADGKQYVNTTGTPGLAKGGSGDVLTGMILSFIMQHENLRDAINNAVYIHGKAADRLIENGHSEMDILATDVIEALPEILNHLYKNKMGTKCL